MSGEELCLRLPDWVTAELPSRNTPIPDLKDRMRLAIHLAQINIEQETGGPFAAIVFDSSHRIVAAGLNLVATLNCSSAHAEIIALSLAEQAMGRYRLDKSHELVVTAEPCAMCAGAIPWSGIGKLVTSATDQDIRSIGFDEGSKPKDWHLPLVERGIEVISEVLRAESVSVLRQYRDRGGLIYNG
jgi:tRNA(Arg) A34 adenosine deaminase TadA